jgi:2,3-bisphosphoglycerate-independent phosphoglycerate mutase
MYPFEIFAVEFILGCELYFKLPRSIVRCARNAGLRYEYMNLAHKPFLLMILDGWGYSEESEGNAILAAKTPHWNKLWQHYPHTLISGSGLDVGLPVGQMGNSEVGHLNMGAGRLVPQELVRINMAIADGSFAHNTVLDHAVDQLTGTEHALHILGLVSPGGVHSHEEHIFAMVKLAVARGVKVVYIHAFLDGRDTPPKSAAESLSKLQNLCTQLGNAHIATLCGRYYAMDRDNRWERIQVVYDMLTQGKTDYQAVDALAGLEAAYQRGETDEFVQPTRLLNAEHVSVHSGDSIVFMNFRADRARQLTRAFVDPHFAGFTRTVQPALSNFVTLTEYAADLNVSVAYPPQELNNVLGAYMADLGLHQLRIAETEKYAHVTFFFNGGREQPFPNEDRILVPSPKVATYDLQPEMSAMTLTDKLVAAITSAKYDAIICNYANADMVGHTGIMPAAIKAVEVLDECLGRVVAALLAVGGEALITADHGNIEKMLDHSTGQVHTAHTTNLVPLVYVGRAATFTQEHGTLTDIAPTLLSMMGLPIPKEMTGRVLMELAKA